VSSTTIFNTSAEAAADTNKTNPTSAINKCEILIKLAAAALSAPASRCGNVSALLSRKSNPNRSKTVWRARPLDFPFAALRAPAKQGRPSPANNVDRRPRYPYLAGNSQRVALLRVFFSSNPNTVTGRTAKIGSLYEKISFSKPDISNWYLRS
jgi:hypothetical protein